MTVSVLIVDDSGFFRRRLAEIIDGAAGLTVIGTAANGREAVEQVLKLKPDVVTMDYEMPVMDGITAVKQIMLKCPTPILMFSSLTHEGARVTLDSLSAGAVDFLPKSFDEISKNSSGLKERLVERILTVAGSGKGAQRRSSFVSSARDTAAPVARPASTLGSAVSQPAVSRPRNPNSSKPAMVAIATSTGGPVALQAVLTKLPASFPLPLVLVQHMPATFTPAFAERLNALCKIEVREAKDGDRLKPGLALLAPGGKQLMVSKNGIVKILPGDERVNYKPCADITFGSAANVYGDKVLAIVLTGMGSDGCEGAKILKQKGAVIWAQDENTSVIYGMPMAIAKAQLADEIMPLDRIGQRLSELR